MEDILKQPTTVKGGAFLLTESKAQDTFIPEEFTEEQLMVKQAAKDFVNQEIEPRLEELDAQSDYTMMPKLLKQTAELGFLGIGVPEAYGGYPAPFVDSLILNEEMAKAASFSLTIGVQTSIGIAPILLYGNDEQRAKYLPKLVTAEWKTCYCLTEPSSGSDANSAKTKAVLTEDGKHYIVNGQKMWITNAGWSNIFIVFAKIDDDKNLSAFIIEEEFGGVTRGAEEKKMGIKGSSTRQVFFNNVKVPVENLLGERGGGFKIAVNVLNTGRIKLGVAAIGTNKKAMKHAIQYAQERIQFGQSISNYGAIKHKLAEMAARTFAIESAGYRTGNYIDQKYDELIAEGAEDHVAKSKSVEEYSIECAILKVYGSESQHYCADEGVQIYGGMGFSAEAPMDRMYRDARITRIFEGTNEINRMLIVDMLIRKAMKGQLDFFSSVKEIMKELTALPSLDSSDAPLWKEKKTLANMKKAAILLAGAAAEKFGSKIKDEQEILMNVADMIIQIYLYESALLRVEKRMSTTGEEANAIHLDMIRILQHEATDVVAKAGRECIYAMEEGADKERMMLLAVKRYTKVLPFNLKSARRRVAETVTEAGGYCF